MVSHGMVCLGLSGQQTSVKFAEVTRNYKSGGVVRLKSPAFFFFFCTLPLHRM